MELKNILFIAAAFSFVAAHEVCAQTAVNTSATAADKTTQALAALPTTSTSTMTQSQQIDFIKTATGEQMEAFVRKVGTDEAQEISKTLHEIAEKNQDKDLAKQLIP